MVNHPHPAATEFLDGVVMRDGLADHCWKPLLATRVRLCSMASQRGPGIGGQGERSTRFMRIVRSMKLEDADAIWRILEPMVRAGETYTLPREMRKDEALAYWMGADQEVFV